MIRLREAPMATRIEISVFFPRPGQQQIGNIETRDQQNNGRPPAS